MFTVLFVSVVMYIRNTFFTINTMRIFVDDSDSSAWFIRATVYVLTIFFL